MLTQAVESYLAVRRAMGFALHSEGSLLQSFAHYSDAAGKSHICTETAIQWADRRDPFYTSAPAWPSDSICAIHPSGGPTS